MTEDTPISTTAEQQALRRRDDLMHALQRPGSDALKAIRTITVDLDRYRDSIRAALGPLEELRRSGAFDRLLLPKPEVARAIKALSDYQARFEFPRAPEVARLIDQLSSSGVPDYVRAVAGQASEIRRAIEAMHTPWLDMQNKIKSFAGFAELQSLGAAFQQLHSFDDRFAQNLRASLGDWRMAITWPQEIFANARIRTQFYADRGLDSSLTDFPAEAFQQSIAIAGLATEPPPLLKPYASDTSANEEEQAFERTNAAHDRLQRFETQLRKYIEEKMTAAFGEEWIKHHVPEPIRERWYQKRNEARQKDKHEWPPIAYADFTDYVPIITRRDNWEAVFKSVFRRLEFVSESFQRLYPIRICTMHARLITQDDELYLYVETKRVLKAIGIVI